MIVSSISVFQIAFLERRTLSTGKIRNGIQFGVGTLANVLRYRCHKHPDCAAGTEADN